MADAALTPSAPERQIPALLPRRPMLRHLVSDRTALAGLLLLVLMFTTAAAAPLVAPRDPNEQDVANRYAPVSFEHPLGTDNLGRDELSRLIYGARVSLFTSLGVGVAILAIGMVVGSIAGFAGGILDGLLMRIVDVLLAFPSLLLALAITGMLGPGLLHLMIGMVAVWWTDYARMMRGLVLSMRERPFVESAQAVGLPGRLVAIRHVLPNIVGPVIVLGTLQTGRLLLALSALSFLGLGVQPPTAEWGAMLSEGQQYLASAPQLMVYPGIAITLAALGFNLLGDGLRDVLDPTMDS